MSSHNESNVEVLIQAAHLEILQSYFIIRSISNRLIIESDAFCGKRKMYLKLVQCCKRNDSWKKMRTRTLYKGIELKVNILCANEHNFNMELQKVMEEKEKVDEWLLPLMDEDYEFSPLDEQEAMLKRLKEGTKAVAAVETLFQKMKMEWLDVTEEMNTVLDDCFERVEKMLC